MRKIVSQKLSEGWTNKQIKGFFVERYGVSVLLEPPTEGFNLTIWLLPPFAVGVAFLSILFGIRRMRRHNLDGHSAETAAMALTKEEQKVYFEAIETLAGLTDSSKDATVSAINSTL